MYNFNNKSMAKDLAWFAKSFTALLLTLPTAKAGRFLVRRPSLASPVLHPLTLAECFKIK